MAAVLYRLPDGQKESVLFTGLVEDLGRIISIPAATRKWSADRAFGVLALQPLPLVRRWPSMGVCLTVVAASPGSASVEVGPETALAPRCPIWHLDGSSIWNDALQVSDRLGGHIVTGHVDGPGHVSKSVRRGDSWDVEANTPRNFALHRRKRCDLHRRCQLTVNSVSARGFLCRLCRIRRRTPIWRKNPSAVR